MVKIVESFKEFIFIFILLLYLRHGPTKIVFIVTSLDILYVMFFVS